MNAILITSLPDGTGVDLKLSTDASDPNASLFVKWLYDLIHKTEAQLEEASK